MSYGPVREDCATMCIDWLLMVRYSGDYWTDLVIALLSTGYAPGNRRRDFGLGKAVLRTKRSGTRTAHQVPQ